MNKQIIAYTLAASCFSIGTITTFMHNKYQQIEIDPNKKEHKQEIVNQLPPAEGMKNINEIVDSIYYNQLKEHPQYQIKKENSLSIIGLSASMYILSLGFLAYAGSKKDE
ncbi:MAG: hypothetical protein ACOCQQ_00385 [Candidatus Nanoarchaeia archaeon]